MSTTVASSRAKNATPSIPETLVRSAIQHAAHYLPSQGPITAFVHHNTLHAFEDQEFERAVLIGAEKYDCQPYWPKQRYRAELQSGRILLSDIEAVLHEDLGDEADRLIAGFGTRYALRLVIMQFPIRVASAQELHWLMIESDALKTFREEVPLASSQHMISQTRAWSLRQPLGRLADVDTQLSAERQSESVGDLLRELVVPRESASDAVWEAFALQLLWKTCQDGVAAVPNSTSGPVRVQGPRSRWLGDSKSEVDRLTNEVLIRFCAAVVDQGFAGWRLPHADTGFFPAFVALYSDAGWGTPTWMRGLRVELLRLASNACTPVQSIVQSLDHLGIREAEVGSFLEQTLLSLRGWAGILWQMETAAPWAPRPLPDGTLLGFVAAKLLLERQAFEHLRGRSGGAQSTSMFNESTASTSSAVLRQQDEDVQEGEADLRLQRAFVLFQLAQFRGWTPAELQDLSPAGWQRLVEEVEAFDELQRRRTFHLAYERAYRNQAFDAVLAHCNSLPEVASIEGHACSAKIPVFQVVTCIDDREESFRRHLEETEPNCETFGLAGFFAVAMYYRSETQAHYQPLCPNNIVPQHYVREEPVFSASTESLKRSERRRAIGRVTHSLHANSRTLAGGVLTGVLGSLATFPLVARVLAPRLTAKLRGSVTSWIQPLATELHIERLADPPGEDYDSLGYSLEEMAAIVVRALEDIGLVRSFAPLVLFLGHGSSSLNNPHESAYNCGACSGGRGGPNARAFAVMANNSRVRKLVAEKGIQIPDDVRFLGGYHNTCNDSVEYYDLDALPRPHRKLFNNMQQAIDVARACNAHERARRFYSCPLDCEPAQALQHVEQRAEDLSQVRPEYNHATNALCIVGRRQLSRGLFLDRRSFLASYDSSQDDSHATKLARILAPVIPVCAGISLEYYFSTVDSEGYGCGSKLPHNITGLAGVMTGAASDLRPGLSAQMVEIHEPLRITFIVESTTADLQQVIEGNPAIARLVDNGWVHLAVLDRTQRQAKLYFRQDKSFIAYSPGVTSLPQVTNSQQFYCGHRDHLGFASIVAEEVQ